MDKDSKGLLKYFSILIFTILYTPGIFVVLEPFFKTTKIYDDYTVLEILIGSVLVGFFIGLLVPVIITTKAVCEGWSRHLDWFFNRFIIPTIVFIGLLILVSSFYLSDTIYINLPDQIMAILAHSLLLVYFSVYLVIIINNIIRLYKKISNPSKQG